MKNKKNQEEENPLLTSRTVVTNRSRSGVDHNGAVHSLLHPGKVVPVVAVEGDEEVIRLEGRAVRVGRVVVHVEGGAGVRLAVLTWTL